MRKDKTNFSFNCHLLIYYIYYRSFREGDATIINNSYAYETVSLDAMNFETVVLRHAKGTSCSLTSPSPGYATETQTVETGSSVDIETFFEE